MTAFLVGVCGLLGLLIGSFLNVVIWRVPRGESVVSPPSHCPGCDAQIAPRDNIPVLSWLLLRGRCRNCGTRISARYPAVELATGLLFAALAAELGPHAELPAFLYLAAIAVALAMIDIDTRRLPNAIVLPSYGVAAVLLTAAATAQGDWGRLGRAGLGAVVLFGFYFLLVLVYPKGMGFGDVKLAGVLGLYLGWLGWGALTVGAFLAFLLGGVLGAALMAVGKAGRKTAIPFGPWMLAGALIAVFVGQRLADAYTSASFG
ncbi:MAG: leader peptidase (prepilin peptidase) / N-methyltransferase [Frankiales bacterium]|nr:leader peptidase (prepilin peptidase) / N-methyltransferase [Frankiales bacterium]